MGRKLLIVASKRYGDYVKEIAESMGCFEEISFVDNDREGAIGKLEDVESFYPEYNCAIAACDDGTERLEWNKKLEALYNIPVLFHMDSTISPSANAFTAFSNSSPRVTGQKVTFTSGNNSCKRTATHSKLFLALSSSVLTFPK